jgi:hypothetical protein
LRLVQRSKRAAAAAAAAAAEAATPGATHKSRRGSSHSAEMQHHTRRAIRVEASRNKKRVNRSSQDDARRVREEVWPPGETQRGEVGRRRCAIGMKHRSERATEIGRAGTRPSFMERAAHVKAGSSSFEGSRQIARKLRKKRNQRISTSSLPGKILPSVGQTCQLCITAT